MALGEEQHSLQYPLITDTERTLLVKLIIAEGGGSGGGGGAGVQQVFPGHYGGAPPVFTPPKPYAVAPDLDPPFVQWSYNPDTASWQ